LAAPERPVRERGRRPPPRRKVCAFCADKDKKLDYKEVDMLQYYLSDRGKIKARRKTGTCARHQRILSEAIKRARHLAFLPFSGPRQA
jgi:small subunit ribosomal protein S18